MHFGWLVQSERLVAVKRTHPQLLGDAEECGYTMRLAHPNVVPTLGVIRGPDEHLAVMEYAPGASVAELLDTLAIPIDPRIASALAAGALRGLHAARTMRDVSPASILVAGDGQACLIDFDLPGRHTGHTIIDKLPYTSPEQLLRGRIDVRRDVYAVAVVLWEALTGQRLFRAPTVHGMLRMILTDGPVAPPSRFAPWISPAVDAAVLRGLARDPTVRFTSALEMARELERTAIATSSEIADWLEAIDPPYMRKRRSIARAVTLRESKTLHSECSDRIPKM